MDREDKGQKEGERGRERERRCGERKGEGEEGEEKEVGGYKCTRALHHMILCLWSHDSHVMVPMGSSSDENTVSTSLSWLDLSCWGRILARPTDSPSELNRSTTKACQGGEEWKSNHH